MSWGKIIVLLIALGTPLILIPYEVYRSGNVLVIYFAIVVFMLFSIYYTTYHKE